MATKKEVCLSHDSFAYHSGLGGLELKKIEHGIDDYIYCVSGVWTNKKGYHKVKIYDNDNGYYIMVNGYKIPLNECARMKF